MLDMFCKQFLHILASAMCIKLRESHKTARYNKLEEFAFEYDTCIILMFVKVI